jgi:hypothetical protein
MTGKALSGGAAPAVADIPQSPSPIEPGEGGLSVPDTPAPRPQAGTSPGTQDFPSPNTLRARAIPTIARQELREAVFGWAIYLTAAVALLAGVVLVYNAMRAVGESGLEIVTRPFYAPLLVATSLAALYLTGWASLSIARPREQGALRVLFFGPVDAVGLLAAHLVAGLALYGLFLILTLPLFGVLSSFVNLPFPSTLLLGALVSPALLAPAIALGLFLSAIAPSGRSAVFLFLLVMAAALGIQVGYGALLQMPPTSRYYDALLFLRELLGTVQEALRWISPLALLSQGLDAADRGNWRELGLLAVAGIVGTGVWLALAAWAMRRRGVLP